MAIPPKKSDYDIYFDSGMKTTKEDCEELIAGAKKDKSCLENYYYTEKKRLTTMIAATWNAMNQKDKENERVL